MMIIWVPNLVITLMFQSGEGVSDLVHTTGAFLIAAQGLLDSLVYGLNTKELQNIIYGIFCCAGRPAEDDPNDVPYPDRTRVGEGKSVSVSVDLGGRRRIK